MSMERVNFLIPKYRWYRVLCCLCSFIQKPSILLSTRFYGLFVFILKLYQFYLNCKSCRTLRSLKDIFQSVAFTLLSFNRLKLHVVNSEIQLSDCGTIHSTLCFCPWNCKVLELCTLGPPGLLGF